MAIDSIIANIANASARVAGATRDAARPTGARFNDLLIAAPRNHSLFRARATPVRTWPDASVAA